MLGCAFCPQIQVIAKDCRYVFLYDAGVNNAALRRKYVDG